MIKIFSLLLTCTILLNSQAATVTIEVDFNKRPASFGYVSIPNAAPADPKAVVVVDQKDKQFIPQVITAPFGATVILKNSDAVKHNAQGTKPGSSEAVDLGMINPNEEATITVDWQEGSFMKFGCNIHPKMQLHIGCITSSKGSEFNIDRQSKKAHATIENVQITPKTISVWFARHDPIMIPINDNKGAGDILRDGAKVGTCSISVSP